MRLLFWLFAVTGLLLGTVGLGMFESPEIDGVLFEEIDQWYVAQAITATLIGGLVGAGLVWLAPRRIDHRPHEHARDFLSRVAAWGVLTVVIGVGIAGSWAAVMAAVNTGIPLSPAQRVAALLLAPRLLGVVGMAALAAALAFGVGTRAIRWGGQYALIPLPSVARPKGA